MAEIPDAKKYESGGSGISSTSTVRQSQSGQNRSPLRPSPDGPAKGSILGWIIGGVVLVMLYLVTR